MIKLFVISLGFFYCFASPSGKTLSFPDFFKVAPDSETQIFSIRKIVPATDGQSGPTILEYYIGQFEGEAEANRQMSWLYENVLLDDQRKFGAKLELHGIDFESNAIAENNGFKLIKEKVKPFSTHIEDVPNGLFQKNTSRWTQRLAGAATGGYQSFMKSGMFWVLVRTVTTGSAIALSTTGHIADKVGQPIHHFLMASSGLDIVALTAAGLPGGLVAGGLNLFSGPFGVMLSNKSFARFVLSSPTTVMKTLRKTLGLNDPGTWEDFYNRNKLVLLRDDPDLYKQLSPLSKQMIESRLRGDYEKAAKDHKN